MADDSSVEITIVGRVDPSVAASVSTTQAAMEGLGKSTTTSAATMAAALQMVGNDIKKLTPEIMAKAAALGTSAVATEADAAATVADTVATTENTVAVAANTTTHVSSRAATEALVLVHELLQGRYTRMTGSSLILTQALVGQESVTKLVTFATSAMGAAIIGSTIALGLGLIAAHQIETQNRDLTASTLGVGAASGVSSQQVVNAARTAAIASNESSSAALASAEAFAAAGLRSEKAIASAATEVKAYAALTGQTASDAQTTLAEAMRNPIKMAQDMNSQLGILTSTQMEEVRMLTEQGDKTGAVNVIMQALKERTDAANAAGLQVDSTWSRLVTSAKELWHEVGLLTDAFEKLAGAQSLVNAIQDPIKDAKYRAAHGGRSAADDIQRNAQLKTDSNLGQDSIDKTPEGRDRANQNTMGNELRALTKRINAQKELGDFEGVKRTAAAIGDLTHAVRTYIPEAEKAHRIAELDGKIAVARHAHDKDAVNALSTQKALLQQSGVVESDADARTKASDAGTVAEDRTRTPKGAKGPKGPSIVSEWTEQLHTMEITSNDFFGDQTEKELKFWQGKIGQVTRGSREWLEIQSHIYSAQKTLAHQGYDDHLAVLNEQLQADHNVWNREKADWAEKLEFIKSKHGEQSAEYRNAYRDWERALSAHDDEVDRLEKEAGKKAVATLKKTLQDQKSTRETNAGTDELKIQNKGSSEPLGEIKAAVQIGQMHRELAQQEIEDAELLYNAESALLSGYVKTAEEKYTQDSDQYRNALQDKLDAKHLYDQQMQQMDARLHQQQIRDILTLQGAYHQYVDGTVGAAASGISKMIAGTGTLRGAVVGVYNSIASMVEQQLTRMVSQWIVQHLLMSAAQRAQLALQTAQHVGGEVAKTAATVAGTGARVATTAAGATASAAITSAHNLKEITSHAAAAAAAAYHAMAGIPIIGPVLGAAAAVATFAAVEAFGALASFDVGTNYVPTDMVAQIHAGERIIPAADNADLMNAVRGGGGGGKGDMHLTYAPQLSGDTPSFRQQLSDHSSDLMAMIRGAMRDGSLARR